MQDLDQTKIITRGSHASELLKSETLNQALDDMLWNIYGAFLNSQTDADALMDLHRQAVSIKNLRGTLQRYDEDGKVEKAIRKEQETRK